MSKGRFDIQVHNNSIQTPKMCILAWQRESLKSKDIITAPNNFETKTIWTVQFFLVMLENKENKKRNTKISVGKNFCLIQKQNRTKQCSLWLHEKLAILLYPNQSEHLNKRFFFLAEFSFRGIHKSQDCWGRRRTFL